MINTFATSRRLWWGVPLLLIVLWVAGSLLPPGDVGIPQAPWSTWVSLPVVRYGRDIAAAITLGCVIVGGLVVPSRSIRALRWASAWALLWLGILVVQFILTISDVLAVPLSGALDPTTMWSVVTQVDLGRVFMWQFIGVLVVGALSQAVFSTITAWVVALVASGAALAPSFLGHGGLTGGHAMATISLAIHLVAISVWIGGLAALVALLRSTPTLASSVLPRFSAVALGAAVVAAESGLLNSSLRLSQPGMFIVTWYGALVLGKVVFIGWLAYFGMMQRRRVVPALDSDGSLSTQGLIRYATAEFVIMGLAVGVAVSMSRIGPTATPNAHDAANLISVALLIFALPQLVPLLSVGSTPRWLRRVRNNPEIMAVVAAVACIELFGLSVVDHFVGTQFGALIDIAIVLVVGWLLAVALTGDRQRSGVYMAMGMWIVACAAITYFQMSQPHSVIDTRAVAAATITGLVVLSLYLVEPLRVSEASASPLFEPSASPTQ